MTYREALVFGEEKLNLAGVEEYKLDAWLLFQTVTKIDRSFYYTHMSEELSAEHFSEYENVIQKRSEHIPLQYIVGTQEFMGLEFKVNSNVLIPRQDTETLVEEALKVVKSGDKVLDLCTGSGCILISILKNVPGATGIGSDISKHALLVARENGKNHEMDMRIEWIRGNMFDNITETFDVIVSNPPYIPAADILGLMPEVRDFEPVTALDGGNDGLDFYRIIAREAGNYLKEDGYLLLEIGHDQGEAVKTLLLEAGYSEVRVCKDLAGNDRVVCGKGERKCSIS